MGEALRVATINLLTYASASGPARSRVTQAQLARLGADVIALQEVTRTDEFDQAAELVGPDYAIIDVPGGDPVYGHECLATRLPVRRTHRLDAELAGQGTGASSRARALAVEIDGPVGPVMVVHHTGTFQRDLEAVREQQAVATARFVNDLVGSRADLPVVLLGDFNACPEAASIRFLTGRQSLDRVSVYYEDAWEAVHGSDLGYTFEPRNPLVRAGQMPLERGRRIDYVLVRGGAHGALCDVRDCQRILTEPVEGVWPSDHYGVLADLQPPPHPPGQWAP